MPGGITTVRLLSLHIIISKNSFILDSWQHLGIAGIPKICYNSM